MCIVLKYGGTSLESPERVRGAARRIARLREDGERVAVVVSAQGHTTDALTEKVRAYSAAPKRRELDMLLATGEQVSAALMAMTLEEMECPAVSLTGAQAGIRTDGCHGNAEILRVDTARLERELEDGRVPVVTGFQGLGPDGDITTLGRGGSDTSAVALAAALGAEECLIYTDVDGVYDRDPRRYPDAVRYPKISYDAMLALAREGAQVLHYRCVELAREKGLKIRVLSSLTGGPGTLVSG